MNQHFNRFLDFHAGHFLQALLQEQGHDGAWLSANTGRDEAFLEDIMEQPNMDGELFVRLGKPMEPLFLQRVHETIFGDDTASPVA